MKFFSKRVFKIGLGIVVIILVLSVVAKSFSKKESAHSSLITAPTATPTPKQTPAPTAPEPLSGKPPQFVVMAFDGSRSLDMWQKTLGFAEQMNSQNTPVHFTYFLSGVYFLNYRKKYLYTPPKKSPGESLIGFADSNKDIEKRIAYVNQAIAQGHEIGSHANGHYDGSKWSETDWQQEFDAFNNLIFSTIKNNDVQPADVDKYGINLDPKKLAGFRSPELGKNPAMFNVLKNNGFAYDTSKVGKIDAWPTKLDNGLWEFPLATIKYASTTGNILSMDYNFYFKQSGAKDVAKKGDANWSKFYNDTYSSYINYFNSNYQHNRAPVFIGSHFSEWNDGVYWAAMRDFAKEVCNKPEVRCITFSELQKYLEENKLN